MLLKKALLFVVSCLFSLSFRITLFAQKNPAYPHEVEARIKQVEQSLGETIKTEDTPIHLQKRLKVYNVPGVSIAVI